MDRSLAFALALPWALAAHAGSGGEELSMHSKSIAAASFVVVTAAAPKAVDAPFTLPRPRDIVPELLMHEELDRRSLQSSCESGARDVCYDVRDGRIVYKPARKYMPEMPGLRAESISLKRDRLVLRYSFR
jgi:hypothetical protein